jgi:hypothetical protein
MMRTKQRGLHYQNMRDHIVQETSATIISSASAAWSSPDVHHRRPLATFSRRRWSHQHLRHLGLILRIHCCRRHQLSAAAQQGEPQSCPIHLSAPAHTPLSFARSIFALADAKVHERIIVLFVTSTAFLLVTARAGRGREPRLDRLDAPHACAMPRAASCRVGLSHSRSDRACASLRWRAGRVSQAILSRVACSRSFSVPVVKRSLANVDVHGRLLHAHRDGVAGFEPRRAEPPHRGGSTSSR